MAAKILLFSPLTEITCNKLPPTAGTLVILFSSFLQYHLFFLGLTRKVKRDSCSMLVIYAVEKTAISVRKTCARISAWQLAKFQRAPDKSNACSAVAAYFFVQKFAVNLEFRSLLRLLLLLLPAYNRGFANFWSAFFRFKVARLLFCLPFHEHRGRWKATEVCWLCTKFSVARDWFNQLSSARRPLFVGQLTPKRPRAHCYGRSFSNSSLSGRAPILFLPTRCGVLVSVRNLLAHACAHLAMQAAFYPVPYETPALLTS